MKNALRIVFFSIFYLSLIHLYGQDEISVNVNSGCPPLVINFSYENTDDPTFISWDFGNSSTLSGDPSIDPILLNPTFSYIESGTYTISVTVTSANGSITYTSENLITVFEEPLADLIADETIGCGVFQVNFSDLSTSSGNIAEWNWDFGDAGSSSLQNPSHNYTVPGIYDVSLSVTDNNGCNNFFSLEDYITVYEDVYPEFEWSISDSCGVPSIVTLVNQSNGSGNISYTWDFGNTNTSNLDDPPPVVYNDYGDYIIELMAENDLGCAQSFSQVISIEEYEVSFSYDEICLPSSMPFFNESNSAINEYSWNFGDPASGSDNLSSQTNPVHLFSAPGTYTVTLTASINGECGSVFSQTVNVLEAEEIDYELSQDFVCELPESVSLSINNLGIDSYTWELYHEDDDEDPYISGSQLNSVLNFSTLPYNAFNGSYSLVLNVEYANGCSSTLIEENAIIVDILTLNTQVSPNQLCEGEIVYANDLTFFSLGIDSYTWDWGDGDVDFSESAEHSYDGVGTFEIHFTASSSSGLCTADTSISVYIGNETDPSFEYSDTTVCINDTVPFFYTGDPSIVDDYYWYYNGLIAATIESPYIAINDISEEHLITLVTVDNGCRDTSEQLININALGPKSIFSIDDDFFCKEDIPYQVFFTNNSETTENSYFQWSFSDSYLDSTNLEIPIDIIFQDPGEHEIILNSIDTLTGCEHQTRVFVNIDAFHIQFNDSAESACDSYVYFGSMSYSDVYPINEYALTYYWDFGDGQYGTTSFPDSNSIATEYLSTGDYEMKVYATNEFGCADTISQWVEINASPVSLFSIENPNSCLPFDLIVNNNSLEGDTSISDYQFVLGPTDTIYFNEFNPIIPINNFDNTSLSLTVIDHNNCSSTSTQYLNPYALESEIILPDFLCYDTEFIIENNVQSDFPPLSYLWEFGNGFVSTEPTPALIIDQNENDTLLNFISITDSLGCSRVDSFYIYVAHPDLSFGFSVDESACPPMYCDFSIYSPDSIAYFTIDYGDGESNTVGSALEAENISHVYLSAGYFDVSFTVTDFFGCSNTLIESGLVEVPGPWAEFTFSPNSGCPPLNVSFEITAGNDADEFFWVFGDGNTSTSPNVTHSYQFSGVFTPILVLQDSINYATGDSIPCIVSIPGEDIIIDGPELNFEIVQDTLCFDNSTGMEIINYTSSIPGFEIDSYLWNFGDGGFSLLENPPSYVYTDSGYYDVSLSVTTENGCEYTITKENAVFVMGHPPIQPYFLYEPSCVPMLVDFYSDSSLIEYPGLDYIWDFGDGFYSSEIDPTHIYEAEGSYSIAVNLDYLDCSFIIPLNENVETFPIPDAVISSVPIYTNNTISDFTFTNASAGEDFVEWWLNGEYISSQNSISLPAQNESIELYLIASNSFTCSDTAWLNYSDVNWNIANIITPNGDGINDYLVFNLDGFGDCVHLSIYNRWGMLIYDDKDYHNLWNGKNMRGEKISDGTYFYIIDLCNQVKLSGYITVTQ